MRSCAPATSVGGNGLGAIGLIAARVRDVIAVISPTPAHVSVTRCATSSQRSPIVRGRNTDDVRFTHARGPARA